MTCTPSKFHAGQSEPQQPDDVGAGFFPGGGLGSPGSENFARPPNEPRPRFLTRACPQLSFCP